MKEPVKARPALLRGIALAVEELKVRCKVLQTAVQNALCHGRAPERRGRVLPDGEQRFLVALFQVGEGIVLRLAPLDLARKVDVPVVFQTLMYPLRLAVLL